MSAKELNYMTIEQFNTLDVDDTKIYELVNGLVMMSPRPSTNHQMIMSEIHLAIGNYLKKSKCRVLTEIEIELDDSVLVPDLFVFCKLESLGKQRYEGGPKLVIEILSPSTAFNDMNLKLKLYEKHGVEEYWIVAPNAGTVTMYHFEQKLAQVIGPKETIESIALQGLEIKLTDIFVG